MYKIGLFLFLFISITFANVVGATKGKFSVSQGSANYNLEILTPKGVAGLKPSLSISYNSSNKSNGILGVGFSLNGLSQISKCNKTLFEEKKNSFRNYNYCLDGQKLVLYKQRHFLKNNLDSSSTPYAEYKTQIDSYSKIIKDSSGWLVYTKDGLIYEYGKTSDSKDLNSFYRVNKIKDRYNNEINFIYDNTLKTISKIIYANNTIDFVYEHRKDNRVLYSRGVKYNLNKRLKKIKISKKGIEQSSYQFDYKDYRDFTQLSSIKECVSSTCLKPIYFYYENEHDNFNSYKLSSYRISSYFIEKDDNGIKRMLLDINGDKRVDKLHVSNSKLYVALNNGDGFDSVKQWTDSNPNFKNGYINLQSKYNTTRALIDVNSDGLPDKVYSSDPLYPNELRENKKHMMVQFNTGKGFSSPEKLFAADHLIVSGMPPSPMFLTASTIINNVGKDYTNTNYSVLDINGDGYMDRVRVFQGLQIVDKKTGETYTHSDKSNNYQYVQRGDSSGINQQFIDMNGDSLPDRVINYNYLTNKKGLHVALNTGKGFSGFKLWDESKESEPTFYILKKNSSGIYSQLMDINGDGLPDRVQHKNYKTNEKGLWVALNTGEGFATFENWFEDFSFSNEKDYYLSKQTSNSSAAYTYKTFVDVDSNGLVDIVFNNDVYFNMGKKFIKKSNFFSGASTYISKSISNGSVASLLDINGDGFLEKVEINGSLTKIKEGDFYSRYKIDTIRNYRNEDIDIKYSNLYDKNIYSSSQNLTYPNINVKSSPMQVVKSFSINNGIGSKNKTSFSYEDLSFNLERGNLGFRKIISVNEVSNTKSVLTYKQEYPYIGVLKTNETYVNDKKVSKVTSEYEKISRGNYLQVYLKKSIEESFDYDTSSSLIKKITNNSNIDEYGNIKNVIIQTQGAYENFRKIIENKYDNENEDSWIIGRLSSSSVSHEASGKTTKTRISKFEYDSKYGTLIKEIIEPENEKSLIKTYFYPESYKGNKQREEVHGAGIDTRTTIYKYDDDFINLMQVENNLGHKEVREYYSNNLLKSTQDINGLKTLYEYDQMGRKVKQILPGNIITTWEYSWENTGHKVIQKTNEKFPATVYYDGLGREIKKEKIGFDGRKIIEETKYDKKGNKEYVTTPYFEDKTPEYIYYKYDAMNRLYEVDSPSSHDQRAIDTIAYEPFKTIRTNAKGQTKTTKVNALGKTVYINDGSTINYSHDALGNLETTRDANGNTITISYDIFGNKIKQIDPDMGTWTYTYYSNGELKTQTDAKGQTISFKYDKLGRVYEKNTPEGTISFIYDTAKGKGLGKIHKEIGIGITKEYEYDDLSRIKTLLTKIGDKTYTQSYTYDSLGRLDKRIEPNNITFTNNYNENGYLDSITTPKKGSSSDYNDHQKLLAYYMLKETEIKNEITKINLNILNYEKKRMRYQKIVEAYGDDELYLEYNGKVLKKDVISELKRHLKSFDKYITFLKKLSTNYMAFVQKTFKLDKEKAFSIFFGNHGDEILFNNKLYMHFTYQTYVDPEFRILDENISTSLGLSDAALSTIAVNSHYMAEELSENTLLYTGKNKEIYEYYLKELNKNVNFIKEKQSQKNILEKRAEEFTKKKDAVRQFANSKEIVFYKVIKKNALGLTTEYLSGNGLRTKKEYDDRGILYSLLTGYETGDNIRDLSFNYDVLNNLTNREDKKLGTTQSYIYDSLNRLDYYTHTDKNGNDSLIDYEYDEIGNIINKTGLGTYEYNSLRPHAVTNIGDKTYAYDANGNMTKNDGRTITYNSFNKPSQIIKSGKTVNFYYDANNKRYKKTSNYNTTYYINKSYEENFYSNGEKEDKYFIYAEGKLVSTFSKKNSQYEVKYMHYDNLGSIDTVTNGLGVVEERFAYKPFGEKLKLDKYGEKISNTINSSTNRGFTGHEHIEEFDLIHMNGRVYDPIIGRFLSADPHIQDANNSQSYNRYTYVLNNPLKYTDPSGFFFKKLWKKIKKWIKPIITIVVAVVATIYLGPVIGKWVATWGTSFATTTTSYMLGTVVTSTTLTGLGAFASGAITGAIVGGLAGVTGARLNGMSWNKSLRFGFKSALAGAITGGVSKYYGKLWNSERVISQSLAGGVGSEVMGGKFKDGFKTAFITTSARYVYGQISSPKYNKSGDPHLWQEGKPDVGKQLENDYWEDPKHFDEYGNKIIPLSSDQSSFMNSVAKGPYMDAFAEFHDGLHDIKGIPGDQLSLILTMPPSYAVTLLAASQPYANEVLIYRKLKKRYR